MISVDQPETWPGFMVRQGIAWRRAALVNGTIPAEAVPQVRAALRRLEAVA